MPASTVRRVSRTQCPPWLVSRTTQSASHLRNAAATCCMTWFGVPRKDRSSMMYACSSPSGPGPRRRRRCRSRRGLRRFSWRGRRRPRPWLSTGMVSRGMRCLSMPSREIRAPSKSPSISPSSSCRPSRVPRYSRRRSSAMPSSRNSFSHIFPTVMCTDPSVREVRSRSSLVLRGRGGDDDPRPAHPDGGPGGSRTRIRDTGSCRLRRTTGPTGWRRGSGPASQREYPWISEPLNSRSRSLFWLNPPAPSRRAAAAPGCRNRR